MEGKRRPAACQLPEQMKPSKIFQPSAKPQPTTDISEDPANKAELAQTRAAQLTYKIVSKINKLLLLAY